MFQRHRVMDIADLLQHLRRSPGRMQTAIELYGLGLGLLIGGQFRVGLRQLGVKLVAFHSREMTVGEVIVPVDRIEHRSHVDCGQLLGLTFLIGH